MLALPDVSTGTNCPQSGERTSPRTRVCTTESVRINSQLVGLVKVEVRMGKEGDLNGKVLPQERTLAGISAWG